MKCNNKIKVLILDGQDSHQFKNTTEALKKYLNEEILFDVSSCNMFQLVPKFAKYRTVVLNYNGFRFGFFGASILERLGPVPAHIQQGQPKSL